MQNSIILSNLDSDQLKSLLHTVVKAELKELLKELKPKQPNEYLTRSEVAKMFSIDISSVNNWSKSGKLNPLAIGGRVYFLLSEIEASLKPLK